MSVYPQKPSPRKAQKIVLDTMTTLFGVKPYYSILRQNGNELHGRKLESCDTFLKTQI